jgi:hypothetical protein
MSKEQLPIPLLYLRSGKRQRIFQFALVGDTAIDALPIVTIGLRSLQVIPAKKPYTVSSGSQELLSPPGHVLAGTVMKAIIGSSAKGGIQCHLFR